LLRGVVAAPQAESDQEDDEKIGNHDAVVQCVQMKF
jgi:hypothetical protein